MPTITKQAPTVRKKKRSLPKATSLIDRIGQDWPEDDGIKALVYGKSGTGKTTFMATWPGEILHINCSGKGELRSIGPALRKKIEPIRIHTPQEFQELVEYQRTEKRFKTIVVDHVSGFQDLVLKDVLELDEIPVQGSWGMAQQQEWGTIANQMKERLRDLLSLPVNVIILAQERDFNTESSSELILPTIGAAVSPSVAGWLNAACDYIVQTYLRREMKKVVTKLAGKKKEVTRATGGFEYCLRTGPHDTYTTKFRIPKGTPLPEAIVNPTYEKMMALVHGEG